MTPPRCLLPCLVCECEGVIDAGYESARRCEACGGLGEVEGEPGFAPDEPAPEDDAPAPADSDCTPDVQMRDALEWDGRRRRVLARATCWREVRR